RHVEQAIGPTVTALRSLAVTAGVATLVLAGLLVVRDLRRTQGDLQQLQELGVGSSARAGLAGLPLLLAVLGGGAVGFSVGWSLDPGPVGLVGVLDPVLGRQLVGGVPVAAAALSAALAVVV